MKGFEDVKLSWKGTEYTVPANKQLMLIAKIEDALAGDTGEQAIAVLFRKNGAPHSRLAAAFGAALRYAGASVTDEDVYLSIHADIASQSRTRVAATIQGLMMALLEIISPPTSAALRGETAETEPEKKT